MDRRGKTLLGFLAATLMLVSAASATDTKHPLRAMAWLAPEGRLEALTTEPIARLNISDISDQNIKKITAGQTLFHTPSLLGGQAAKAGISCASCHTNGRTNPHFQFPGVSGAPGTADVTHSFFSSHRGDGEFNPVVIPDLAHSGKVSHDPQSKALEDFIKDLIIEEFDGAEPSEATLDALSSYVRSLAAPDSEGINISRSNILIETHFDRVDEAFFAAENALRGGDHYMAKLLFAGCRHQVGLIHQRFRGERFRKEQKLLEKLGRDLGIIPNAITENDPNLPTLREQWELDFSHARDVLGAAADHSLYDFKKMENILIDVKN